MLLNSVFVKNIFSKDIIQYANNNIISIKSNIDAKMKGVEEVSQKIIYDKNIYDLLLENSSPSDVIKNYEHQITVSNILKNMMYSQLNIKSISIYNNNYINYTYDIGNGNGNDNCTYDDIKNLPTSITPTWYYDNSGIWLFRSIFKKDGENQIGVMVIRLKEDAFKITQQKNLSEDISLLISESAILNLSNGSASGNLTLPYYEKMKLKNGSYVDNKNKLLVCFISLENAPWNIVYTTSLPIAYRTIHTMNYLLLLSGIISSIILIGFNIFLSYDLLTPINTLVKNIKLFEKDNTLLPVSVERADELGYLMKMFNRLIEHLETLIRTIYIEKQSRDAAQIKALQAQINPHFLYNTLETINQLALMRNAKDISEMILSLSTLMRANAGKINKTITLDEELVYTRSYCNIMQYRFKDELEFRFKIEDETRSMFVPALTLYPLIENSVLHGLGETNKKGLVHVRAFKENSTLILEIVDNGTGIENSTVAKINSELKNSEFENFTAEKSIGLSNTNKRIKLLFGSEYGIKVFSKYGHYCKVQCCLPVKKNIGDVKDV